ncbi:MAG: hypothetical protein LRY73_00100 [Bacillus sp. (in: Bacteria)]|nr:hypothetical protein [Bacillus sp. (in: firmicutes)]
MLSIAPTFTVTLMIVIFITFAGGISNICMDTIMMKTVPKSRQGTFFGFMATLSNTALGISMASAGFLLEVFSPRELSFLVGVAYIGLTLLYGFLFTRVNIVKEKRELYRKLS